MKTVLGLLLFALLLDGIRRLVWLFTPQPGWEDWYVRLDHTGLHYINRKTAEVLTAEQHTARFPGPVFVSTQNVDTALSRLARTHEHAGGGE